MLLESIEKYRFNHLGVFKYSDEEGTPAYNLGQKVAENLIEERYRHVYERQKVIVEELNEGYLGKIVPVLVEGLHPETPMLWRGRHEGQAPDIDGKVIINEGVARPGDVVNVEIRDVLGYDLLGWYCEPWIKKGVLSFFSFLCFSLLAVPWMEWQLFFAKCFLRQKSNKEQSISLPPIPRVRRDPKDVSQIGKRDERLDNAFFLGLSDQQRGGLALSFIDEVYEVVLGRKPIYGERDGKLNVLLQGGTREGLYRSLVLGEEYRVREMGRRPLSEENKKFVENYQRDYLRLQMKFEQTDFWTLKRFVVERSLEVLDSFEKREDVSSRFAVLSEEFEKVLSWEQAHRKLSSRVRYFQWANRVPLDIVKSEVILKIHYLMNSLR